MIDKLRFTFTIFAFTLGAVYLLNILYPVKPVLTGNTGYITKASNYHPGGSDCEKSHVDVLPIKNRRHQIEICKQANEEYRLQTNDLIQQRRSADAADAMAILSYRQTEIAAWGIALGFVTMAAAIAAAFYARHAAIETKRSGDIAMGSDRAWLTADGIEIKQGVDPSGETKKLYVTGQFRNVGNSPALEVKTMLRILFFQSEDELLAFRPTAENFDGHTGASVVGPTKIVACGPFEIDRILYDELLQEKKIVLFQSSAAYKDFYSNEHRRTVATCKYLPVTPTESIFVIDAKSPSCRLVAMGENLAT